jgi:hypothetical protein
VNLAQFTTSRKAPSDKGGALFSHVPLLQY